MRHPRVRYHEKATPCTALTSARSSLRMLYSKDDSVRSAARERAACKNAAHWGFRALKGRGAWAHPVRDGDYCWAHLLHFGVYGSMEEEAATERHIARWIKGIEAKR